jgi:hypothetical protein
MFGKNMGVIETKTKEKIYIELKTISQVIKGMKDNDLAAIIQSLIEVVEDHESRISNLEKS